MPVDEPYPWRQPKDLATVLVELRAALVPLDIVADSGSSESEIAAAEQRGSRPFPEDVKAFYRAVRPTELFAKGRRKDFGFYPLGSKSLKWRTMDGAEPAEDWAKATALPLGQTEGGDPFWWVDGHRTAPDGSIFLLDHDGGLGDVMFGRFARTFREFLAKLAYFKSLGATPKDELFLREYRALNPSATS